MASITRWDPLRDLANMERSMGRFFADLGTLPMPRIQAAEEMMLSPSIDVMNRGEDLVIRAEMPGIKSEDIDVSVTDDMLTIHGKRSEKHETKDNEYLVKESSYGEFERTMRLPAGVSASAIHAECHDGVLEVTVPKAAQRTMREAVHIPIETRASEPAQLKAH